MNKMDYACLVYIKQFKLLILIMSEESSSTGNEAADCANYTASDSAPSVDSAADAGPYVAIVPEINPGIVDSAIDYVKGVIRMEQWN